MLLLDFDDEVESFEEQPVTIPLLGVSRGYTPDVLVRFRADPVTGGVRVPLLTEIKHSDDLKKNAEKYASKFTAAEQYASERGWQFALTTEKEIRTVRLANLKFLREYRNIAPGEDDCSRVLKPIEETNGAASLRSLLTHLTNSEEDQMYWLPVIWHLVLMRWLTTNLDVAIGSEVNFRLPEKMR